MRKNLLRSIAAAVLCTAALWSAAANRIVIKDFAIKPGETKVVEVIAESDEPVRAIEVVFALPEGLSLDPAQATLTERANGHTLTGRLTSQGYKFLAFSLDNNAFAGTSGVVFEVPVTASSDFQHSGAIMVSDIVMENAQGEALVELGRAQSMAYLDVTPAPAPAGEGNGEGD